MDNSIQVLADIAKCFDCDPRTVRLLALEKWGRIKAYVPKDDNTHRRGNMSGVVSIAPSHQGYGNRLDLALMDLDWIE